MKLKQKITLKDVLNYLDINYRGCVADLKWCAESNDNVNDCLKDFEYYYCEHGLGTEEDWKVCRQFLILFFEMNTDNEGK